MKKFVIIILPCLLIVAVYMFGGSLFNDKPKTFFVLSTPGAHGPSTGVKEYPGELKVATASAHLQNLHIRGNLYLSPENGGGLITLSNVQVDGALIIIALEDLTVGLRDVTAPTLTVSRSTGKVTVISQGSTQIALSHISGHTVLQEESPSASGFTQLTLADEAKVELLGSYTTLMVNGTNTELQLTTGIIEKIQVQKGLAGNHITINQDAVVQLLELHTAAEVVGEGIIEEAVLYVPNVELALTPNKLTAPEATIPEEDPTAMEGDQTPVIIYPFSKPTLQRGETIVVPVRTMPIEGISLLVSSKNSRIVTASVQGEEILLRAIAPGTTSITVITSHPEHSDASTVFSVTVAQVVTAAPTASTGSGEVAENTAITLNTATAAATIYYTTDGSQPTTGSLRYDAANPPVVPAGGFTLKAMASKDGQTDSAVVTYTYATPAPNEPPPDDPPPEEEPLPEPQDPDEEETAGEDE